MSKTVDQRVVEMRFDNNQFEKGISESIKSLDKLKASLNFDNAIPKSTIDSISNNLNGLTSSVDSIADKFSVMGIAATTAIAKISSSVMDLAQNAIQNLIKNAEAGYDRYNEMMGSIQTIMYATRNEWADTGAQMDYVTSQIDKLNWYTDETSYNLSDMTNSIGKFVSAGVSLDDATTAMEGIASWAAISGQNAEKASYAMYNLSQAMSMGKVTTVDWKSIENANMATREFKWVAKETAIELGKLWTEYDEEIDDWYTVGLDQYGNEMRVTLDNFRNTLAGGWFDSEVLTAVLKKYGGFADELYEYTDLLGISTTEMLKYVDEALNVDLFNMSNEDQREWLIQFTDKNNIKQAELMGEALLQLTANEYELGRAAFKAAQESKTLKDSLDYTADAITTTWMNIFQDIFGNYLESKELWTEVSEVMYECFVQPLEEVEAIFSSWNSFGGADNLKDALFGIYEIISQVRNSFKEGFEEIAKGFTGLDLAKLTNKFEKFVDSLRLVDFDYYSDLDNLKEAGRSIAKVFEDFKNNLTIIGDAIKAAWDKIFPKKAWHESDDITRKIQNFTETLADLSEKFKLTGEDGEKLERTFAGIFAVLDILRMLIVAILEPFTGFHAEIDDVNYGIFDITASIGDWLVALRDFIKENEIFKKAMAWLTFILQKLPVYADNLSKKLFNMGIKELLTEIVNTVGGLFLLLAGMFIDFEGTMDKADEYMAKSKFANIWPTIKNFIIGVKNAISDLKTFFKGSEDETEGGVFGYLSNIWSKIKAFFETIKEKAINIWGYVSGFATGAWEKLTTFFSNVKEDVTDIFSVFSDDSLNFGQKIQAFFSSIGNKISNLWDNTSDDTKDAWSAVGDFFGNIGKKITEKWSGSKVGQWFISLGEKVKEVWGSLSDNVGDAWSKIKEFLGLAGTKAGEIWDSIPGWVETAWTNIKDFFNTVRAKFLEIWDVIQPYAAKFTDAMKKFGDTISEHWEDTIWPAIVGFFSWLGENGAKVIDFIKDTDWGKWWSDIKGWCEDAWHEIRKFFEELPGKAKQAFEDLTGITWEDFLQNLSDKWQEVTDKVQELWDKISDFVQDVPGKLDEFAKHAGFNDFSDMWSNLSASVGEAYKQFRLFFGLDYPEWVENPPEALVARGWDSDMLKASYVPPYKEWLDKFIPDLEDITKSLDGISSTDWKTQVNVLIGIATFLGSLALLWKIYGSLTSLIDEVENFRPFKSSASMMAESVSEAVGTFKKVEAAAAMKMYADTFIEIAAALAIIAFIPWPKLIAGVVVLGGLFAVLFFTMKYLIDTMEKKGIWFNPTTLTRIAAAFDMMGGVLVNIAGALWIVGQLEIPKMLTATGMLLLLFVALASVFVYFDAVGFPNAQKVQAFALAFGELSGAIMVIALAMAIIGHMRIDRMIGAAVSLGALFGALVFSFVIIDKFKVSVDGPMNFAKAMGALSGTLIVIAIAMSILKDMDVENMLGATLALSLLFLALISAFVVIDKMAIKENKMRDFAIAMDILSISLLVIATSLRILKDMSLGQMMSEVLALGTLFALLAVAIGIIGKINVDEGRMFAFAGAMGILGVAMVEMAAALYILKDIDPKNLWGAVGALLALSVVLTVIGGFSASAIGAGMLIFATAFLLLGAGAMAAGLGINLVAQALERLSAIGVEGFTGIADGLTILSEAAPHIVEGFLEALMRMAEQAGPIVVAFFTGFANAINDNREDITNGIVNFWMILIDAFNRVVPELINAIASAVNQIINKVRDVLVRISHIINANRDLFTQALTNFLMIFIDTLRNVGPEFVDAIGEILRAIVVKLQEIWPDIEAFLLMAGETALLLLGQLVTGLIQILYDNGPLLLELLRFLFEGTLGIIEEYTPIITSIAFELLMDTLNQILDNIDDVVSVTTQIAIATINGFIDGITEQIPNIIDKGVEFVLALINGVAQGLDEHAADIKDAMDNLARAMLRAFLIFMGMDPDQASSTAERWVNIGKDIMESLIQGISSMVTECAEAIRDIAQAMTEAWTNEVDEHSPSKEFEKHGMYLDLGLVNGVEKNKPQVISATKKMADDAIESLSTAFKNVKDKMFGDFEFDPTITPVLDLSNVTEGANYINDLFSADRALALAGLDSDGINNMVTNQDALNSLLNKLNMPTGNSNQNQNGVVNNNTFNITGDDPQAIANEISNILQSQVERRDSVWA